LARVNQALSDGHDIGIKLVSVLPDDNGQENYRLLNESMLIYEFKQYLDWNTQK